MSANDSGGPAFSTTPANYDDMEPAGDGMTLRDYFAAKAMQGFMVNNSMLFGPADDAQRAYMIADAMLAERAKVKL